MILHIPASVTLYTEQEEVRLTGSSGLRWKDVTVAFTEENNAVRVFLQAEESPLCWMRLRWNRTEQRTEPVRVFGDAYERAYGDLRWTGVEPERILPWYVLVSNGTDSHPDLSGRLTEGFGVMVQPNAIAQWQYDEQGVTLWLDVRCGGRGVLLGGRTLSACTIVSAEYRDMSAFEAGCAFCRLMSPAPVLPHHKVYGSNNWYYAYGNSSQDEILADTGLVAERCAGLENPPYMVIDDGWEKYSCDGPWDTLNKRFSDMKALASSMKAAGVRPGIWVRYLSDSHHEIKEADESWYMPSDVRYLDPSVPEVLAYVRKTTRRLRDWGYELIKHDFSTVDCFGRYGFAMTDRITKNGWAFHDRSKTSAEIMLTFYRTIREAAGEDCVIIGCNTISHLAAGLFELNRTGDDTSGQEWNRTRKMGVNTLAMRLMQNGSFYMADADCVGILGDDPAHKFIPWKLNRQWLYLLARSGSPLFVSCKPGMLTASEDDELREAWAISSVQENTCRPLDWMDTETPAVWCIDGETVNFAWYDEDGVDSFRPRA